MTPKEYEKIHAKSIIIDLDGTLSIDDELPYKDRLPNLALIATLKAYKDRGWRVVIYTSRAMRSYAGDVEKIKAHALPEILEWLGNHGVPYDEVIVGKAWCGKEGFYVDDRALRPSEFVNLSEDEIILLLQREKELANFKFNEKISQKIINFQKNSSKKPPNSKPSKPNTKEDKR